MKTSKKRRGSKTGEYNAMQVNPDELAIDLPNSPQAIPLATKVMDIRYNGDLQYSEARLPQLPDVVALGLVQYSIGGVTYQTSVDKWNTAAKDSSGTNKYPIPNPSPPVSS